MQHGDSVRQQERQEQQLAARLASMQPAPSEDDFAAGGVEHGDAEQAEQAGRVLDPHAHAGWQYRHENHKQMLFLARGHPDWKLSMAPQPSDLLWENTK